MTPVMLNQVSYSMNISTMSIEQYLVHQAKLALKLGDPYASKSWMITARTMFAENFSVQVSAFFILGSTRSHDTVAKALVRHMENLSFNFQW